MKNIFLAFLLLAGTAVMAQTGAMKADASKMDVKAEATANVSTANQEIQKSLDITAAQAEQVMAIQQKFCGPDAKSDSKTKASSADNDKAFHAALTEVISAEQADKFMKDCKVSCAAPSDAKAEAKGKSCCASAGTADKKSCSDKKK